jgi:hypothetical protein
VTYLAIFGILASRYPDFDVYQKPLAEVTVRSLVLPVLWFVACLVLMRALFSPASIRRSGGPGGFGLSAWAWSSAWAWLLSS